MHFSKIYLQENFVPDFITDQFKRKVIGIEITLNEGESLDEAKQTAENYIKEYIQENTIIPHQHIEERFISQPPEPTVLPEIQVEKKQNISLLEQICFAETIEDLKEFDLLVKMNPNLQKAYDNTYNLLLKKK